MLSCHGHHDLLLTHPTLDFHSSNVSNRFDFEPVLPLEGLEEEEEGEEEGGGDGSRFVQPALMICLGRTACSCTPLETRCRTAYQQARLAVVVSELQAHSSLSITA